MTVVLTTAAMMQIMLTGNSRMVLSVTYQYRVNNSEQTNETQTANHSGGV